MKLYINNKIDTANNMQAHFTILSIYLVSKLRTIFHFFIYFTISSEKSSS